MPDKKCRRCGAFKPESEFYSAGVGRGVMYCCKLCDKMSAMKSRRNYVSCVAACESVELVYDCTIDGVDKFIKQQCGRYCCRESKHTNVDTHHFCFVHRKRVVVIINGLRDHMNHVTNFDRVDEEGRPVIAGPFEAHFMSDGRVRRSNARRGRAKGSIDAAGAI